MNSALVTPEMIGAARQAAGLPDNAALVPGPGPLASPSYLALESASVMIEAAEGGAFLKVMHPEMRAGFDLGAAMQLARQAGEAGVGPVVLWSDAETGAIAMQALEGRQGWRRANQASLQDPAVLAQAMAALKTLQGTTPLARRFDPFAEIDWLTSEIDQAGHNLPEDLAWLRATIGLCQPILEGAVLKPCRNDGSASNLMIRTVGEAEGEATVQVMLVDFDRAGMMDPLYEVGALLAEVTDFERNMKPGFIAWNGSFDEVAFARARLWSFVDDLLHGLWARYHAAHSVRQRVEWIKYSEWRLMRLRLAVNHPGFEEKLRLVGGQA